MNVFSRIYANNEWNGIETRSGPGSHREPTRRVSDAIVQLVDWLWVASVTNVGCGEDSWMPDLPGYTGCDIAPEALDAAHRNHPERHYFFGDATKLSLPPADLFIVRDVVQHLSFNDGVRLLANSTKHGGFLLASTYVGSENIDIVSGDAYSPNLCAPPFSFPPPLLLIHDGYEYHDGDRLRDPAKMLGLWRL